MHRTNSYDVPQVTVSHPAAIVAFGIIAVLLAVLLLACTTGTKEVSVDDQANLLTENERQRISAIHHTLATTFNIHCSLVILKDRADDINATATELFETWGRTLASTRGLMLLIDPKGKRTRIEVGYDLEGIFPDLFVGYLEREQMAPFFSQDRVGAGIEATEELLITRLQRDSDGLPFEPRVELGIDGHYSGGAGARHDVEIGAGHLDKTPVPDPSAYPPGPTPEASLRAYRQVLHDKVKDPNLPLYTSRTRTFLSRWVVTDAQQDNELRTLQRATIDRVVISGNRAVIRFPLKERTSAPYFLENDGNGWAFDFATMNEDIRMNHHNMWHFINRDHPYMFGFSDWRFDANGFPAERH